MKIGDFKTNKIYDYNILNTLLNLNNNKNKFLNKLRFIQKIIFPKKYY